MKETERLVDLLGAIAEVPPGLALGQTAELAWLALGLADRIARRNETLCERELTPRELAQHGRERARIEEIGAALGATRVEVHGDPRGYAVYLRFPSGASNSWGGPELGWGIG